MVQVTKNFLSNNNVALALSKRWWWILVVISAALIVFRNESDTRWLRANHEASQITVAPQIAIAQAAEEPSISVPKYSTPGCTPHPTECKGVCDVVGNFVKQKRHGILANPKSWSWYYQGVSDYYRCSGAKKIVEVGVAYGAQTAFHLKNADFIEEYHVVDPFMAGYDPEDPMSKLFTQAAPNATPDEISKGWFTSMAKHFGTDGMYMDEGMPPAGCKLRMHHAKSHEGAELFGDFSVDAVFIDGLHTYEGVVVDIKAWLSKIKIGGSLIFNDYNAISLFPGVSKAVKEEAARQNIDLIMLDRTNALMGGKKECAKGGPPLL